jgi:hypothetical protein
MFVEKRQGVDHKRLAGANSPNSRFFSTGKHHNIDSRVFAGVGSLRLLTALIQAQRCDRAFSPRRDQKTTALVGSHFLDHRENEFATAVIQAGGITAGSAS